MATKEAWLFLILVVVLFIASEVAARDLAENSAENKNKGTYNFWKSKPIYYSINHLTGARLRLIIQLTFRKSWSALNGWTEIITNHSRLLGTYKLGRKSDLHWLDAR